MNNGRGAINPQVQGQASALYGRMKQMATPNNVISLKTQDKDGIAGQFPIQLGTADPMDQQMAIRQQAIGSGTGGVVDGMGMAIADQPVFDYLERKKENLLYSQFIAWINSQANLSDPAQQEWWFTKFPFLKEKRLEEIHRVGELQMRLAEINVTGAQNEDDMLLLYMIQNGLLKVPTQPLQNLYLDTGLVSDQATFARGIFSPLALNPSGNVVGGRGMASNTIKNVPTWNNPIASAKDPGGLGKEGYFPTLPDTYKKLFPGS